MALILPGKADQNDLRNLLTESFLYDRFKLLMINQFKWTGPEEDNIQERHLENFLFSDGYCLFFEDPELGPLCLHCHGDGQPNVYGDHIRYKATGFNYTKVVKAEDSVLIENNKLRMPTEKAVLYFVGQLFDLVRSMDVNVLQLRLQCLFVANDNNILTVKKIIDEIDKNNWAIISDTSMPLEEIIKAIETGVKCYLPELTDRYNAVMNEALTYFGINNANTDKKERLITNEVDSNNQFIDSCVNMFLESRERACEEINKKFGRSWSVELRNKRKEVVEDDPELIKKNSSE